MSATVGHSMKLYRNTGTVAVPVWTEIANVGDVNIPDLAVGLAELKRRGNNFTKNLPTLFTSMAVEFRLLHGLGATVFDGLRTAFFARTINEYAVMNGDITVSDNQGLRLPAFIEQFPWDQNLEEVSGHDCRLAIAYMEEPAGTEIDPSWYTVP